MYMLWGLSVRHYTFLIDFIGSPWAAFLYFLYDFTGSLGLPCDSVVAVSICFRGWCGQWYLYGAIWKANNDTRGNACLWLDLSRFDAALLYIESARGSVGD